VTEIKAGKQRVWGSSRTGYFCKYNLIYFYGTLALHIALKVSRNDLKLLFLEGERAINFSKIPEKFKEYIFRKFP
jgi:hypothetical protein